MNEDPGISLEHHQNKIFGYTMRFFKAQPTEINSQSTEYVKASGSAHLCQISQTKTGYKWKKLRNCVVPDGIPINKIQDPFSLQPHQTCFQIFASVPCLQL